MLGTLTQAEREQTIAALLANLPSDYPDNVKHLQGAELMKEAGKTLLMCNPDDVAMALEQLRKGLMKKEAIKYFNAIKAETIFAHAVLLDLSNGQSPLELLRPTIDDDANLGLDYIVGLENSYFGINVKARRKLTLPGFSISNDTNIPMVQIGVPFANNHGIYPPDLNTIMLIRKGIYTCFSTNDIPPI